VKDPRYVMLVTAQADESLREEVARRRRPCPDYLELERAHGVELIDWSILGRSPQHRSRVAAARLAIASLARVRSADAVLSDGEPVGVPLALAMRAFGINTPHLMIGHLLTARHKRPFFTLFKSQRRINRIPVHSYTQMGLIPRLGIPAGMLAFIHYHADTHFWKPLEAPGERLVLAAGREHRDYLTLARATTGLDAEVFIADGSAHNPKARYAPATGFPSNLTSTFADYVTLRELYSRAQVVVVPLLPNDFQAGVTTLLEAMAMGKAVIVSETSGQRDVVQDGVTGLTVPPSDPRRLRSAIEFLLDHPHERAELGRNARRAVERSHSLELYARNLARHLEEIQGRPRAISRSAVVGDGQ
jgi:glycosyltransferase involved in cell wall biosynthesis